MDTITATEAYRRTNARELVETMLGGISEDFEVDLIIEALLEADPYEREFADIDNQGFWEIARKFSREIQQGDTVIFGNQSGKRRQKQARWVVLAAYTDSVLLESPAKYRRTIPRRSGLFENLVIVARHGRPDLHE
jgi:hypothetical protein